MIIPGIVESISWTAPTAVICGLGYLVIHFLMNPAKVEKWSSMLASLLEKISTRAARHGAASEVQSAASAYVKRTDSKDVLPYGLKIDWVKGDTVDSHVDKRHGDVVVIMPYKKNRSRSFVTAIRGYTSKAFIPMVRHDIPPQIVTAAELVIQEKIIRAERMDALEIFKEEVLSFQIGTNQELDTLHKSLKRIEEMGFFENIFLNEILVASEGLKTFDEPYKTKEIDDLIEFLMAFYKKAPREDIALSHNRELFKLSVILVAKESKILAEGTHIYAKRANKSLSRGLRSIYVTGTKDDRKYVTKVVDHISNEGPLVLEWVRDYRKTKYMKTRIYTIAFFRR